MRICYILDLKPKIKQIFLGAFGLVLRLIGVLLGLDNFIIYSHYAQRHIVGKISDIHIIGFHGDISYLIFFVFFYKFKLL